MSSLDKWFFKPLRIGCFIFSFLIAIHAILLSVLLAQQGMFIHTVYLNIFIASLTGTLASVKFGDD